MTGQKKINNKKKTLKYKEALEPLKTFRLIKGHMGDLCQVTMGNYYDPNWKWNWRPSIVVLIINVSSLFFLIDGYNYRHEWQHLVYVACLIPYSIMGLERTFLAYYVHKPIFVMMIDLEKYTERWEQDNDVQPILLWYSRTLKWVVFTCSFFFVVVGLLMLVGYSIIYYIMFGKMDLLIQLYIPGVDFHSHPGFEMHVIFHGFIGILGTTGYAVFIISMIVVLVYACAEADIIMKKEQSLQTLLEKEEKKNEGEILSYLREIYNLHQEMLNMVDTIEELWSIMQLSDHLTFGTQIILVLYILMQEVWLPGFFIIAAAMFIIFTINFLGTIVEVKLDSLSIETYNVPWYLLSLQNQKDYCYFLSNTQNTTRLTLRGGPPLNLDTFVRFCKGIYSYLMVLREMT